MRSRSVVVSACQSCGRSGASAASARRPVPAAVWRPLLVLVLELAQLSRGDQLHHDLTRRTEPPIEREHTLDRVAHLLVGAEHDPGAVVAVEPDRQRERSSPRSALLRRPPSRRAGDRVQIASGIVPFSASRSSVNRSRRLENPEHPARPPEHRSTERLRPPQGAEGNG